MLLNHDLTLSVRISHITSCLLSTDCCDRGELIDLIDGWIDGLTVSYSKK